MAKQETAVAKKESILTVEGALEVITAQNPEAAKVLRPLIVKDVIALGTDNVFALRDDTGEIRAFKQMLHLSAKNGTLTQPVPGGDFVISAQGYEAWCEAAGANVIMPPSVLVDGQMQPNPYIYRDPVNRRILAVYARAVAFRFSSKGIPMVSDWTTIFDNPSYRLIDLLAKAKKMPQAFKLLPAELSPADADGATWASYPFDESTNLWINTSHEEALQWFSQILNREKKSIDFAQTFARRNAAKHLSGLQKAPANEWNIPVICWRPINGNIIKWDQTRYASLQEDVSKLSGGDGSRFGGEVQLITGTERAEEDAVTLALEHTTDIEDQPPIEQEGSIQPQGKPDNMEYDQDMRNLAVAEKEFPKEFEQALFELGLDEVPPERAGEVCQKINNIIDGANQ